jgi:putative transposase
MRKTLKYRLYECDRNKHLHRSINASAQIWNHALALHKRFYSMFGKYVGKYRMQKHIAKLRNQNEYWQLVGSQATQDIVERLDKAYQRFFKWVKTRKGLKASPPKFKSFRKYKSFTLKQAGWKLIGENRLTIQGRSYKFCKSREVTGQIKTVTIKRDNMNHLWVFFSVVEDIKPDNVTTGKIAGMDFGLKQFLTMDDESTITSPQFFRQNMRAIARRNKELATKKKGSNNRKKAKHRLAKAHEKAANQRRDWHFKTAHSLLDRFDTIYIEDLCIGGMKARWGRKVSDLGFSDFVLILEHLAARRGKRVKKIDRWAPTSKTCSYCGEVKDSLSLSERMFECSNCHVSIDRDVNAAINIKRLGHEPDEVGTLSRESDSCCSV